MFLSLSVAVCLVIFFNQINIIEFFIEHDRKNTFQLSRAKWKSNWTYQDESVTYLAVLDSKLSKNIEFSQNLVYLLNNE